MIQAQLYDGTVLEFPEGTDPQVIQRVVKEQTAQRRAAGAQPAAAPAAPAAAPAAPQGPQGWGSWLGGLAAAGADGIREGVATFVGAPVDLVNNAPRLANILPGVENVGTITEGAAALENLLFGSGEFRVPEGANTAPFGGIASVDRGLRGADVLTQAKNAVFGAPAIPEGTPDWARRAMLGEPFIDDFVPRTFGERVVNRVGQEIGATAVPYMGAMAYAAGRPVAEINRMAAAPRSLGEGVAAQFAQPLAVAPAAAGARETAYAIGSGAGAGLANEFAGENAGFVSDMLGSLAGVGAVAGVSATGGTLKNLAAGATSSKKWADDVASSTVADRLMTSSAALQADAARLKELGLPLDNLSTDAVVQALRREAPVEQAFPGYRANIADRTRDPGMATLAFNVDARSPGAAAARRVANEGVVDAGIRAMAPEGDPARFAQALQAGVDARIAGADAATDTARLAFDDITQALQPTLPTTSARGSLMRSALSDAYQTVRNDTSAAFRNIEQSGVEVPVAPYKQAVQAVDDRLPMNDRARFRPSEADLVASLEGETVPYREIGAVRSGLTDDILGLQDTRARRAADIRGQYVGALDDAGEATLPDQLRAELQAARAKRRDQGERFERPGTALERVLSRREGGGFALDDSAVPRQFAQPDTGKLSDLQAALREAGSDDRFREALADEVRAEVTRSGLLNKPDALGNYLGKRNVLLSEFPELRGQLEKAGATRAELTAAERAAAETRKTLTTPGRSAEAAYLSDAFDPAAALRKAIVRDDPAKAISDLVSTAGGPQAKMDLRAAFWEEVKRAGRMQADGMTGEARWNGKKLRALFDDPKLSRAAEELWRDDPEDLKNIKDVFSALASAEGSTRARAPGSSGTPQAISDRYDPAVSLPSMMSSVRSVSRNQMHPTQAVAYHITGFLRRRSQQVQERLIDEMTAEMINNPGLAANLLERYNPATAAAKHRMLTQKYGLRIPATLNAFAAANEDDPLTEALQE